MFRFLCDSVYSGIVVYHKTYRKRFRITTGFALHSESNNDNETKSACYPFITAIGASLATFLAIPALWTT